MELVGVSRRGLAEDVSRYETRLVVTGEIDSGGIFDTLAPAREVEVISGHHEPRASADRFAAFAEISAQASSGAQISGEAILRNEKSFGGRGVSHFVGYPRPPMRHPKELSFHPIG